MTTSSWLLALAPTKERDNFWPHLVQSLKISSDVDFLELWWTTNIPRHASSNSSNTSYFAPKAQISSGPKQLNVCRRKAWGTKVIPTGSHYVWTLFLLEKIPIVLRLADVCWANLETLDVGPKLRVAQVAPGAKPPGIWVLWRNTSFPAKACGMQHVWSSCGCQTTLSLNTIFMPIMDNSITQRICNRSLASTTHPQKNITKTLSPPKKIHREWGFLVRNLRNDEPIPGVRVERLDFTSVRVAQRNIRLRPKAFVYVGFKENSTPSHLSWILNLTELCFQSGVFQAKMGSARFLLTQIGIGTPSPRGIDGFFQEYRWL